MTTSSAAAMWIVKRPISGDSVLMTEREMIAFLEAPDHRDLPVSAQPAFDIETHECSQDERDDDDNTEANHPLYPLVVS